MKSLTELPLDYPTILKGRIERGEIDYQQAITWLTRNGMDKSIAIEKLLAGDTT